MKTWNVRCAPGTMPAAGFEREAFVAQLRGDLLRIARLDYNLPPQSPDSLTHVAFLRPDLIGYRTIAQDEPVRDDTGTA